MHQLEQFFFPLIMAVLTNSIMIVVMFLLRKSKTFANLFGVGFMLVLYLFCILRMVLPIEFPKFHVILRDTKVYTAVMDLLIGRNGDAQNASFILLYIVLSVWAVVSVILLIRLIVRQTKYKRYIDANMNLAGDKENAMLQKVVLDVFGKEKRISLKKTDAVSGSMVIGAVSPLILIPDIAYSDTELEMILRHECMHIKDNDIWIKLLVQIYCILFWWNPFSYLLKANLGDTLEVKCDLNVVRCFNDVDKLHYAETVARFMTDSADRKVPYVAACFTKGAGNSEAVKRIQAILTDPPKKAKQAILSALVIILFTGIFVISYVFIWQPDYGTEISVEEYDLFEGGNITDETNSYLVLQPDGNYLLYNETMNQPLPVLKEEVEDGLFEGYPIYE